MSMYGAPDCPLCGAHSDYCELEVGVHGVRMDCRNLTDVLRYLPPEKLEQLRRDYQFQVDVMKSIWEEEQLDDE